MRTIFICLFILSAFTVKAQATATDSVTVTVVEEIKNAEVQLTLVPAVTASNTTLKIHIEKLQYLTIDITDLNGTVIRTVASQQFNNGDQSLRVETYGLSKGQYFLSVKTEAGFVLATKLLEITRN